ncbi:threonine synthase [Alkalimonas mucilaginosa]|uniref:Threonine synthase n=1 Tax=Alkalimonas mucilaginosa TaxID=3057676 RepID=A0ABU7JCH3_9GAMM|nr:threonine synthase [Alkalimonas sp. MEB004]MEE2023382.1 threonine synthase [Alkalimonas sp. MEB004]
MQLVNLKVASEQVSFLQAVRTGLGQQQGLFFPTEWPTLDCEALLELPLVERSSHIMQALFGDELSPDEIQHMVQQAFTFPAPLQLVKEELYCLELFHGPTLAFKDFGGRFMAQALAKAQQQQKVTIVTATSGDTGAAVAQAFYRQPGVQVVILYPKGKISSLQEKLFSTLGENITSVAIEGDFDQCQALVKQVFDHKELVQRLNINSANSINISRLLAQVCYYFEALAQVPAERRQDVVFAVPSGNFGNVTAGLIAKAMGLPFKRMVAATNINDTVPRYWRDGQWLPKTTQATLSNAMDISAPNNWPRVEALLEQGMIRREELEAVAVDEDDTQLGMRQLAADGYISEPHAAVAYKALKRSLQPGEIGIFLGTAHPAKFKEQVENILGCPIALPPVLAKCQAEPSLSLELSADFAALERLLNEVTANA